MTKEKREWGMGEQGGVSGEREPAEGRTISTSAAVTLSEAKGPKGWDVVHGSAERTLILDSTSCEALQRIVRSSVESARAAGSKPHVL
jgi:hypothetical protein